MTSYNWENQSVLMIVWEITL